MTGQDAVQTRWRPSTSVAARRIILTKVDGTRRGGAPSRSSEVVGRPIASCPPGNGWQTLRSSHPDRLASRILGMGDCSAHTRRPSVEYDEEVTARPSSDSRRDVPLRTISLISLRQLKKMGPPHGTGVAHAGRPERVRGRQGRRPRRGQDRGDQCSMTPSRTDPTVLDGSRRSGSRTEVHFDHRGHNLLRQFKEMQKMMRASDRMAKLMGGRPGNPSSRARATARKVKGVRVTPSSRGLGPTR